MSAHRTAVAILAALVGIFALIQILCIWSGVLGIDLTHRLAMLFAFAILVLAAGFVAKLWNEHAAALPACDAQSPGAAWPPGARPRPGGDAPDPPSRFSRWVAIIAGSAALLWTGATWLRLWQLAYLRPTYDWDGLYYHIPAMHEWARIGHIAWIDRIPDVPYVNFPMGIEAHTFFLHQLLQTEHLLNAGNLWYWPLGFFAILVLARQYGARGLWPWLAGALIVGSPTVIAQSATNYIDVAYGSCVMAAIAASCLLVCDRRSGLWSTLLWGAAVGLVLSGKGTGLPFAAIFFAVVVVAALIVHGRDSWSIWLPRFVLAALVTVAVGGYWSLRGILQAGNPIYPVQLKIGELIVADGIDYILPPGSLPDWLAVHPPPLRPFFAWLQTDAPIYGFDTIGGMGYIWIAAAVPAVLLLALLLLARRLRPTAMPFAFVAVLVAVLLVPQPAIWWARYTLWLYILGLPALTILLQRGTSASREPFLQLLATVGLLATLGVATWESNRTLEWQLQHGRVESIENGRAESIESKPARYVTSREMIFPGIDEAAGFRDYFAAGQVGRSWSRARITSLMTGTISIPLGEREVWVLPDEPAREEIRGLQENGVRWIFWDASGVHEVPPILRETAVEAHVYKWGEDVVYHALRLPDVPESD